MKKVVVENLSVAIHEEFELNSEISYYYKEGKNTNNEFLHGIYITGRNINELIEECHKPDTYLKHLKEDYPNSEKSTFGDIETININDKTWYKMREKKQEKYSIRINDHYVIVYNDILYEVEFISTGETEYDMSIYEDIIKTFTLNKKVDDIKVIDNLKVQIPESLEFNSNGWYKEEGYIENAQISYSIVIEAKGGHLLKSEDYINNYIERANKQNKTISDVEKEEINGNTWLKLKLTVQESAEYVIDYYYLIDYKEQTYIVKFTASAYGHDILDDDLDVQHFENIVNTIKKTIKFK